MRLMIAGSILLTGVATSAFAETPTFSKDVAPILNKSCVACHRSGEIAPFALTSFKEARPFARAMKAAVASRKMPPWFPEPGYGPFKNDKSLTADEIKILGDWADGGAPEGDPADLPAAPRFVEGWTIGKPDVILDIGQDIRLSRTGAGEYYVVTIDPHFTEDKWIQAGEVRPTNRKVVHHGAFTVLPPGAKGRPEGRRFNAVTAPAIPFDPSKPEVPFAGPGGPFEHLMLNYAPGTGGQDFGLDTARLVRAGSKFQIDLHYTPTGKEEVDRTQIGLVFAKEPPKYVSVVGHIANQNFAIPPGHGNYPVRAGWEARQDVTLVSLLPHMHLRGKDFQYTLVYPDGREVVLLKSKYEFEWQLDYLLEKPVFVPKGSKIFGLAHFDNSAGNKSNPDPTKTVGWCDDSECEMMSGFFNYIIPLRDAGDRSGSGRK